MVRLQKFLAEAGIASRRGGEQIIVAGRVTVNGAVANELGRKVDPEHDKVAVDGKLISAKRKLYLAINKPRGCLCTRVAEEGRPKITDYLPPEWTSLFPVGRLDFQSEGLIFITNDGDFCLKLTHPRYGIRKVYVAKVDGRVEPEMLKRFCEGVFHLGEQLKAERARVLSGGTKHCEVELVMAEGKNREVRRLFESQGLTVRRLQRIQIGPIKLGELPPGRWRTLTSTEVKNLLNYSSV